MYLCDGAGANRLFIKCNTSNLGLGTPNHFQQAWCWNRCRKRGRIFFIPDPAHFLKKAVNNLEKSWVANGTREMWIPKTLVDVILKQVSSLLLVLVHVLIPIAHVVTLVLIPVQASDLPNELVQVFADQANSWNDPPLPWAASSRGVCAKSTEGEECYIYLMGRLYALLSDTFAYTKVPSPPHPHAPSCPSIAQLTALLLLHTLTHCSTPLTTGKCAQ